MDAKLAEKNEKLVRAVEKHACGRPEYETLLSEAKSIQTRCAQTGIQRCTQLVYIGRKAL